MRKTAFAILFFAIAAGLYAQAAVVTLQVYYTRTNFRITQTACNAVRSSGEQLVVAFQKQQTGQLKVYKFRTGDIRGNDCADFASYVLINRISHKAACKYHVAVQIIDASDGGIVYKKTLTTGRIRQAGKLVDEIISLMGPIAEKIRRYQDGASGQAAGTGASAKTWLAAIKYPGDFDNNSFKQPVLKKMLFYKAAITGRPGRRS